MRSWFSFSQFYTCERYGCITSQVRTFFSPFEPVWEEVDLIYVPAGTGFVCSFDKGFYPKGYRGLRLQLKKDSVAPNAILVFLNSDKLSQVIDGRLLVP